MIEERAVVRNVEGTTAWVEGNQVTGCDRCARGEGCGGGLLGRLVSRGAVAIPASFVDLTLRPGDNVIVGLDERWLLRAAAQAYLLPLVAMLLAAALAHYAALSDFFVAVAAVAGLSVGFLGLRLHARRAELAARYRPVVLRKDGNFSGRCVRL